MALTEELARDNPHRFAAEFGMHLDPLITLLTTPIGVSRHPHPMDPSLFIRPSGQTLVLPGLMRGPSPAQAPLATQEPATKRRRKSEKKEEPIVSAHNVDGHMIQGDVDLVGFETIIKTKVAGAKALGKAMSLWPKEDAISTFQPRIVPGLQSPYSSTELVTAMIIEEYAKETRDSTDLKAEFLRALSSLLNSERPSCYRDLASYVHIVQAQCRSLLNAFRDIGRVPTSKIPHIAAVCQGDPEAGPDAFSIEKAEKIIGEEFTRLKKSLHPTQRLLSTQALADAKNSAVAAIEDAKAAKAVRDIRVLAAAAGAYIASGQLPKKLNPVVHGVMESVKLEENLDLQRRSAQAIASLVGLCSRTGRAAVADKLTKNLNSFLCVDTSEVPMFHQNENLEENILSLRKEEDRKDHADQATFEREAREARIKRRGAKEALEQLAQTFGASLFDAVPKLRDCIETPLHIAFDGDLPSNIKDPSVTLGQEVVDGLSTIRALLPKFHPELYPAIIKLFPLIIRALQSNFSVLRYAAAKCFATICSVITIEGMTNLVEKVLPNFANAHELRCRQGAIECVYHLIHVMETDILPYVVFLIVPVLGRMSDSDNDIRLISTTTFATLVKLVPLEVCSPLPSTIRSRRRRLLTSLDG